VLGVHYKVLFLMGLQNDKEFHVKGLAASEIDLHAISSDKEKSKLIMNNQQVKSLTVLQ